MFIKNEYANRKITKEGVGSKYMPQARSSFFFSIDMHTFLKLKAYLVIPALVAFTNKSWWFLEKTCFCHIPLDKQRGRDLQLNVQPVLITTNVESLNSAYGEVYSMQHFVIKFVSDLRNVLILNTFPRSKCTNSGHISTVKR